MKLWVALWLVAMPAFAQREVFFTPGKGVKFKEQDVDRRFKKSKLGKALYTGTDDPNCGQVLGGLFVALAESGVFFHKRDENFTLDPMVLNALNTQMTTNIFPAAAYLTAMVRRVRIDGRLPDEWLKTAQDIHDSGYGALDMAKLKALNDGMTPCDSFLYQPLPLRMRWIAEVLNANSAVTTDVEQTFRDSYLDRDVSWGDVFLIDAGIKKKAKGKKYNPDELEEIIAILQWNAPDPRRNELDFSGKVEKPKPMMIYANLQPKQYIDLERQPKGAPMIVKGRFWELNTSATEAQLKNAILFNRVDFSNGIQLADPAAVMQCPLAVNELTGLMPQQPGGFAH